MNNNFKSICFENIDTALSNGNEEKTGEIVKQIVENGYVTVCHKNKIIYCITVIGQIEGHYLAPENVKTTKYEHLIPQILAVEESRIIDGLFVVLNTVGGDIEAGLALAELIRGMKKPSVSLVLGGGHSIGIPLAVAADTSFIVPSASMTVHPVRSNGVVLGVSQTFEYFLKIQERIVKFVSDNSGIDADSFRKMMNKTGELVMDLGTVLDGETAVKNGIIDRLGNLSDSFDELARLIDTKKEQIDGKQEI